MFGAVPSGAVGEGLFFAFANCVVSGSIFSCISFLIVIVSVVAGVWLITGSSAGCGVLSSSSRLPHSLLSKFKACSKLCFNVELSCVLKFIERVFWWLVMSLSILMLESRTVKAPIYLKACNFVRRWILKLLKVLSPGIFSFHDFRASVYAFVLFEMRYPRATNRQSVFSLPIIVHISAKDLILLRIKSTGSSGLITVFFNSSSLSLNSWSVRWQQFVVKNWWYPQ